MPLPALQQPIGQRFRQQSLLYRHTGQGAQQFGDHSGRGRLGQHLRHQPRQRHRRLDHRIQPGCKRMADIAQTDHRTRRQSQILWPVGGRIQINQRQWPVVQALASPQTACIDEVKVARHRPVAQAGRGTVLPSGMGFAPGMNHPCRRLAHEVAPDPV